jgi:hypothetical protein
MMHGPEILCSDRLKKEQPSFVKIILLQNLKYKHKNKCSCYIDYVYLNTLQFWMYPCSTEIHYTYCSPTELDSISRVTCKLCLIFFFYRNKFHFLGRLANGSAIKADTVSLHVTQNSNGEHFNGSDDK